MNRNNLELALTRSMQRMLFNLLPENTKVINVEDYPSLSLELSNVNSFVAFSLDDGAMFPKVDRHVSVFVFVDKDPGNIVLNGLLGIVAAQFRHGSNVPVYDGETLETQLVVINPILRGITFEVDHFRSKSVEFTVKGVVT